MGLTHLAKNEKAEKELAEKGMALESDLAGGAFPSVACQQP
jgi:hypothetical protein